MKRFLTTIAACVALCLPSAAFAAAINWDGDTNSSWLTGSNWDDPSGFYPGQAGAGDSATIAVATNNPVTLSSSPSNSIASLTINAATNDAVVQLTHSRGTLTTTSVVQLIGGDAGSNTSTYRLNGGTATLSGASVNIDGGDSSSRKAILDYDSGTFTHGSSDPMRMRGYADIDAEESLTVGDLTVDTDGRDTVGVIDMADLKTHTADTLTITVPNAATSYNSTLTLQGPGEFVITNAVTLNGSSNGAGEPKLVVASTGDNAISFGSLDLVGGNADTKEAVLDLDKSITVADTAASFDSFFVGYVNADLAADVIADFKDVLWDASGTLSLVVSTGGSGTADFKTNEFRIQEADDAAITVTKSGSGKINADSFVLQGSTNNNASLVVSGGSFLTR